MERPVIRYRAALWFSEREGSFLRSGRPNRELAGLDCIHQYSSTRETKRGDWESPELFIAGK
jgi:hypothetical protein